MSPIIWLGLVALTSYGITKVSKLANLSKNLQVIPTIRLQKATLREIIFAIDVRLLNNSNGSIEVRKPSINLYAGDEIEPFGSSSPSQELQKLEKWSEVEFKDIYVRIPTLNLPTLVMNALRNNALEVNVASNTTINGIPYVVKEKKEVTI